MMSNLKHAVTTVCLIVWPFTGAVAAPTELKVVGFFSGVQKIVEVEKPFFEGLAKRSGLDIAVNYNNLDVIGVQMPDALRLVKGGSFDIMVAGLGNVARDDPFLEGADIAGVSTNAETLRKVLDAYRPAMDERLRERFNLKTMTLWTAGLQGLFCNAKVMDLKDLKGKKIRTYNSSQALVVQALGAISVTMQMPEVYASLQRGVMECATTSPSAGNSTRWTEVTTYYFPLAIGGAVNAHFINLDKWKKFSPAEQQKLTAEFNALERELWLRGTVVQQDGVNCSTGREPCTGHQRYSLTTVTQSPDLDKALQKASEQSAVATWGKNCEKSYPGCTRVWNDSVGKVTGLRIK